MIRKIIAVGAAIASLGASADPLRCGDAQAVVINSTISSYPYFTVALVSKNFEKFYRYPAQNEFLKMRCEKLPSGNSALLILNTCGGTGCTESNYGLIDTTSGSVLLEANGHTRGNEGEAAKILGKDVVPFSCSNTRNSRSNATSNGEICFLSGVELG